MAVGRKMCFFNGKTNHISETMRDTAIITINQ